MGGRGSSSSKLASAHANNHLILQELIRNRQISPQDVTDLTAAHDRMRQAYADWAKNLPHTEYAALGDYQGSNYRDINDYLRKTEAGKSASIDAANKQNIDRITRALNKARLPEDMTLYRGVNGPEGIKNEADIKAMIAENGGKYYDGAFLSTSINQDFAANWAAKAHYIGDVSNKLAIDGYHGYVLKIQTPKGARAAYVNAATHSMSGEYEILFQRNARIELTGTYHLEQIPFTQKQVWVVDARYTGQRAARHKTSRS